MDFKLSQQEEIKSFEFRKMSPNHMNHVKRSDFKNVREIKEKAMAMLNEGNGTDRQWER